MRMFFALVFAALIVPATGYAEVSGTIRVIDGDTFDVAGTRIRLFGIDAPETDQTCVSDDGGHWGCGAWVNAQVAAKFDGRKVLCEPVDTDRYGRIVARCFVNRRDVAGDIVQAGLAFAYRRYSADYAPDERRAARRNTGLHASRVQSPEQFRRARTTAAPVSAAPQGGCRIKGNISGAGVRIYHAPGQRDYDRTRIRADKGERWFCSGAEARAAGWRAAKR